MEKRKRRRFTAEYKAEVTKRLAEKALPEVAEELGVRTNQLRTWRNEQLAAGSAETPARSRREVRRLEQGNEILKRAAALMGWPAAFPVALGCRGNRRGGERI